MDRVFRVFKVMRYSKSFMIIRNVLKTSKESLIAVCILAAGYGDIYPVSTIGRAVTMASSVFGIAIVALPAGIITAGYMTELKKVEEEEK